MVYPETFEGFTVESPKTWNTFKKTEIKPKPFGEYDIDVKIEACGVCGSDVHTLTGGWGDFDGSKGPLCAGHEVIGKAVRVGSKVKSIKQGARVGVGAQIWSCLECKLCKSHNEQYCPHQVATYNAPYPDGTLAQGGYASHIRAHEYFTFNIPDALPSHIAAPLLCAGLTTFSPLIRAGVGPGKKVGIVGIGGLGHLALQWSHALGATTYALTHSAGKTQDAKKLGADEVIVTTEENWAKPWAFTFDYILNCSDMTNKFNMQDYLSTLAVGGEFHMVGLPDKPLPELKAFDFATNNPKIIGSHIGNHQEMDQLLKLAVEKGVAPWIETIDISEAGCKEAIERVKENKVHYRFTLINFDKVFGA